MSFKNNTVSIAISAIAVIAALTTSGCKKDCLDPYNPECSNYDACLSYEPANAEFEILIKPIGLQNWDCDGEEPRDLEFEVDTITSGRLVYFRASQLGSEEEETGLTYQWKIGTDSRTWTTREFDLGFAEDAVGDVPVTLIVEKADPNSCGGTDYSRDTLTKNLHVKRFPDNIYSSGTWSSVFGKWEGYNTDDESSIFQIEIKPDWEVTGFPDGCSYKWPDVGISLTYFAINDLTPCANLCGLGTLSQDRSELTVNYSYRNDAYERIYRTFVGRKVD